MKELRPHISARLARDVYELTKQPILEDAIKELRRLYGDVFDFADENLLKGKTGALGPLKCRTAFGFVLIGKGVLRGNAFILFRGTHYAADWLTDGNATLSSTTTGQKVHDGFNQSFKSMEPQLMRFMDRVAMHQIKAIHCVGHSLGGALATLCGEWITNVYKRSAYVYSFGSPRVGLETFASVCTSSVGASHIFRAYHKTDIVPFLPTWPYCHVPFSGRDYLLWSPGLIPMGEFHRMKNYVASVSQYTSWESLVNQHDIAKTDHEIKQWLQQRDSPAGLTFVAMKWLENAIQFVVKLISGAKWVISTAFSTAFTVLDQLAYLLSTGAKILEETSIWVLYLIRKIIRIVGGIERIEKEDLTIENIRHLFQRLMQRMNFYAKDALSHMLVDGRAI